MYLYYLIKKWFAFLAVSNDSVLDFVIHASLQNAHQSALLYKILLDLSDHLCFAFF